MYEAKAHRNDSPGGSAPSFRNCVYAGTFFFCRKLKIRESDYKLRCARGARVTFFFPSLIAGTSDNEKRRGERQFVAHIRREIPLSQTRKAV